MTLDQIRSWYLKAAKWFFGIGYYLAFLVCALALADALSGLGSVPAQADFLVAIFLVYATWVLLVIIHELGHATVAWLSRWRVPVISIFSITIWPSQRKIWYGLPAFPTNSGMVLVIPQQKGRLRGALIAIFLGGAAANFLLATAAYLLARGLYLPFFWARYLDVSAALSLLMGIANLLPIGQRRDGAVAAKIALGEEIESRIHVLQLFEEITKRKRPRDWNGELVEQIRRDFETSIGFGNTGLFLVDWHFDRNEMPTAKAILNEVVRRVGDGDPAANISRAFFAAYADADAEGARKLLSTVKSKRLKSSPDYCLALAATERAANDIVAKEAAIQKARIAYRRHPFANEGDFALLDNLETTQAANLQDASVP